MNNRYYGIVNPKAAGGNKQKRLQLIRDFFGRQQAEIEWIFTERPRHGMELAERLAREGKEQIVAVGGDGTAFEVINGIMRSGRASSVRLGILPQGTGNSFLRDFSVEKWEDAAGRILRGNTQWIDVGKLSNPGEEAPSLFFHNMVGFGLIAEGCRLRHEKYSHWGRYAYHAAFFRLLRGLKPYIMKMQTEDSAWITVSTNLVAVCNSQYTGHNMHLSPRSLVTDGKLDLLYPRRLTVLEVIHLFLSMGRGTHLQHPKVTCQSITRVEIEAEGIDYVMVDGEVVRMNPVRLEVIPRALRLFV